MIDEGRVDQSALFYGFSLEQRGASGAILQHYRPTFY